MSFCILNLKQYLEIMCKRFLFSVREWMDKMDEISMLVFVSVCIHCILHWFLSMLYSNLYTQKQGIILAQQIALYFCVNFQLFIIINYVTVQDNFIDKLRQHISISVRIIMLFFMDCGNYFSYKCKYGTKISKDLGNRQWCDRVYSVIQVCTLETARWDAKFSYL